MSRLAALLFRYRATRRFAIASLGVLGAQLAMQPAAARTATPAATPLPAMASTGVTRARPVPLGAKVLAGPIELQVRDVLIGTEAVDAVLAASPHNLEPRDGSTFVAVNVWARNAGTRPLSLGNDDFALTGDSGLVRRFLGAQPPDPACAATLTPGETTEGWVAFTAAVQEQRLLLLFDCLTIGGNWANRVLALQDGARIADLPQPAATHNQAGVAAGSPLGIGEPAITDQWSIALIDVVSGAPTFDLVDYRTGALGAGDAAGEDGSIWVALQFQIQNVAAGGELAHFPANAFVLVDEAGEPLLDIATLTPPYPDAAGGYYPGATRDGWVMFDVPVDYAAARVRFLPYAHTTEAPDPRFFTYA